MFSHNIRQRVWHGQLQCLHTLTWVGRALLLALVLWFTYFLCSIVLAVIMTSVVGVELDYPYMAIEQLALVSGTVIVTVGLMFMVDSYSEQPVALPGLRLRYAGQHLALGFGLGAAMVSAVVGILALGGWYSPTWAPQINRELLTLLGGAFVYAFGVALIEELIDHGLLLTVLERHVGTWLAVLVTASWFGLLHGGNPHSSNWSTISLMLSGGLTFALAYLLTRRIWLSIGMHWGWNALLGPVFGLPVSGLDRAVLVEGTTEAGPALWTGGAFGPEAGIASLLVHAVVNLILLSLILRRGTIVPFPWQRALKHLREQQASA